MSEHQTTEPVGARPIPSKPGYFADAYGAIWSNRRGGWHRLAVDFSDKGYPRSTVNSRTVRVPALVLEAFVGPRPDGMEACHNDGNKANCRPTNLRWDTPKGNHADKKLHGTSNTGSRHGQAKLDESSVAHIKARFRAGDSAFALAKVYGVNESTMRRIKSGATWTHVS